MTGNTEAGNIPTSSRNDEGGILPLLSDVTNQPKDAPAYQVVCHDPENPAYACPICGGLGVVKFDVPVDHPRFGRLHRCPNRPAQADTDHIERIKKLSNLEAFRDKTLENFQPKPTGYNFKEIESLNFALDKARRYTHNPEGWLLLEGGYGCGKTHLAAAIGNLLVSQGQMVIFITVPDLLDHLRQSYQPDASDPYDVSFSRVREAPILILDDLGVENQSEWAKEKLFQLLNHRYVHRIPTIITTNADIENLDPRIRSRLQDSQLIQRHIIKAPDFRSLAMQSAERPLSRLQRYHHMTFENFDMQTNLTPPERDDLRRVAQIAYEYAQQPNGWLLLMGRYGVGKTHLAASIANFRENQKDQVMFITVPDLMDYLRTTFDSTSDTSFSTLFNSIREAPFLVLDDVGSESNRPWVQEKLFQLLDHRYVTNLPTVLTTARATLEDLNDRLASRLIDKRVCRVIAIQTKTAYARRIQS